MKERIIKRLKRLALILLVIFAIYSAYILIEYNRDPAGLSVKVENLYNEVAQLTDKMYGTNVVQRKVELPEKESLAEAQNYYYFQQLSDTAKVIYVTIEKNIDKMLEQEDNIELPASLNDDAKKQGKDYVAKEFQSAWDAFITDKSEYFYIDSSKVCLITKSTTRGNSTNYQFYIGKGDNKTYLTDEFKGKADVEFAKKTLEEESEKIIKSATGNNYEKILYIHDWIVENTEYENKKLANAENAYGCIVNNKAICEGYARAFKYFMDKLNIPCVFVCGDAQDENGKTERHAWNYVYINNNWYAIDTTWDDPIIIGNGRASGNIKYKYFLKGSKTMSKDHKTLGQITQEGMEFSFPTLAIEDF